tara:strand:- start:487 stop:852 length:366 start_codon:yes stop_codon:yes gene_type:complete
MLFSPDRYPSNFGAGGKQDVDFIRYIEWMWMKRCIWLFGFMLGTGALGLYAGLFLEEYFLDAAMYVWGVAWIYNGFLFMLMLLSAAIATLKALITKAFFDPTVHAGQAAIRTGKMMRKGGL